MKTKDLLIAPSVLSADFSRISDDLALIETSGSQWVHLDVMDGSFVPNITFGNKFIQDIRPKSGLVFDTHLMINNPENHIESFAAAGSDYITIHIESTIHAHRVIQQIHNTGKKAGISIIPSTPISMIEEVLSDVELVLVMTVNPGYGGQKLIPTCVEKIARLYRLRESSDSLSYKISVDGGVNQETIHLVKAAGIDVAVTGSAFFSADDKKAFVRSLKTA